MANILLHARRTGRSRFVLATLFRKVVLILSTLSIHPFTRLFVVDATDIGPYRLNLYCNYIMNGTLGLEQQ